MWFLLLAFWLQAASADDQPRTSVEGFVLNAATGEPIRRAQVRLLPVEGALSPPSTLTDAAGHYAFTPISPGNYFLAADRDGYVSGSFGQRKPGRAPKTLNLAAGLKLRDINIKLEPTSAISGRITDDEGEKLANVTVLALRAVVSTGGRPIYHAFASATSNDLGEYRLFGLEPGRYFIAAHSLRSGRGLIYPPTLYPDTPEIARATPINVTAGASIPSIDFRMPATSAATLKGRVSANTAVTGGSVQLAMRGGLGVIGNYHASIQPDGTFNFANLPPGPYSLVGNANSEGKQLTASMPLDVTPNTTDPVVLTFQPATPVKGRIVFEEAPKDIPIGLQVMFESRDPMFGGSSTSVRDNLTWTYDLAQPTQYWLDVLGLPDRYYLKSVSAGREDLYDKGLDLTNGPPGPVELLISNKASSLQITVTHEGAPFSNATVVLVPEGVRRTRSRLFRSALSDASGKCRFMGITPGEYKLFAWEYVPGGNYEDADFLEAQSRNGKAIALREGVREDVTLTLIPDEQ